jgi:hypothetical protein
MNLLFRSLAFSRFATLASQILLQYAFVRPRYVTYCSIVVVGYVVPRNYLQSCFSRHCVCSFLSFQRFDGPSSKRCLSKLRLRISFNQTSFKPVWSTHKRKPTKRAVVPFAFLLHVHCFLRYLYHVDC